MKIQPNNNVSPCVARIKSTSRLHLQARKKQPSNKISKAPIGVRVMTDSIKKMSTKRKQENYKAETI